MTKPRVKIIRTAPDDFEARKTATWNARGCDRHSEVTCRLALGTLLPQFARATILGAQTALAIAECSWTCTNWRTWRSM